ncbi:MAG: PIN domain-containing protein [Verrucomicrobiota bacterium]
MKAILDAGPLIALWGRTDDRRDEHHSWATKIFSSYGGPFFTSEAVLCEVGFMTGRAEEILEAVSKGHFIIGVSLEHDAAAMARVLKKFKHCDLADSSIVALSEKLPDLDVMTTDRRHFVTYRRADKSALPLVLPE